MTDDATTPAEDDAPATGEEMTGVEAPADGTEVEITAEPEPEPVGAAERLPVTSGATFLHWACSIDHFTSKDPDEVDAHIAAEHPFSDEPVKPASKARSSKK